MTIDTPMAHGWKYDMRTFIKSNQMDIEYPHTPTWYRSGFLGKNHGTSNAHSIEFGEHINGSGPKVLSGSKRWPHLKVDISFRVGEEDKRFELAQAIANLINEYLPESE